jgi:hypothetical protein
VIADFNPNTHPAGHPGGVFTNPPDFPKAEFSLIPPVHKTSDF